MERPDRGRIVLDDEVLFDSEKGIDLPPRQRRVGLLFQHYALFPTMTVAENIRCGARNRGGRGEQNRIVRETVDLFQLGGLEHRRPAQLSGGQAQRVALARMLAADPRLLLLDEPFSALDAPLRDKLQPRLRELLRTVGRQTVLVTHSRDEAYRLCETLCILDGGGCCAPAPPRPSLPTGQRGGGAAYRLQECGRRPKNRRPNGGGSRLGHHAAHRPTCAGYAGRRGAAGPRFCPRLWGKPLAGGVGRGDGGAL